MKREDLTKKLWLKRKLQEISNDSKFLDRILITLSKNEPGVTYFDERGCFSSFSNDYSCKIDIPEFQLSNKDLEFFV